MSPATHLAVARTSPLRSPPSSHTRSSSTSSLRGSLHPTLARRETGGGRLRDLSRRARPTRWSLRRGGTACTRSSSYCRTYALRGCRHPEVANIFTKDVRQSRSDAAVEPRTNGLCPGVCRGVSARHSRGADRDLRAGRGRDRTCPLTRDTSRPRRTVFESRLRRLRSLYDGPRGRGTAHNWWDALWGSSVWRSHERMKIAWVSETCSAIRDPRTRRRSTGPPAGVRSAG